MGDDWGIPARVPDTADPGADWGLPTTVGAVLIAVIILVGLAVALQRRDSGDQRWVQTIGPVSQTAGWRAPKQPPAGIGSTDLYVATLTAADTPAQVGGVELKNWVMTTKWSTVIASWEDSTKTLKVSHLPADALLCLDYGGSGPVCSLPAEWMARMTGKWHQVQR